MNKKYKAPHRKKIGLLLFSITIFVFCLFGISLVKANLIQVKMDTINIFSKLKENFISYPELLKPKISTDAKTIPVLVYHGILNNSQEIDRFSITQDIFREQMTSLYEAGYRTVTIEDFKKFMEGKKILPAKSFLLTFDDGRKDSFYGADPILERLGYTAVMFTASGQSANKNNLFSSYYLNILELKKMIQTGRWEIQSHAIQSTGGFIPVDINGTKEYFLSNKEWLTDKNRLENEDEYRLRISKEFSESKSILESISLSPVFAVSYPFSDFGQQTKNNSETAVEDINYFVKKSYLYAFQQQWSYEDGFIGNDPRDDPYHFRRIEPASNWSGEYLTSFLHTAEDIEVTDKVSSFKNDLSRWKSTWGKKEIVDSKLVLRTLEGKISSFTLLDGSRAWKNYQFSVDVLLSDTGAFALYANLERPGTGVRCVWREGSLSVEQMIEGKIVTRDLFSNSMNFGNHTLSIISKDGVVGCVEDGLIVGGLKVSSLSGGVGVEFWHKSNEAHADIIDAYVTSFKGEAIKIPEKKTSVQINNQNSSSTATNVKSLLTDITVSELEKSFTNTKESGRRYLKLNNIETYTGSFITINLLVGNDWGSNSTFYSRDVPGNRYDLTVADYLSGLSMWLTESMIPQAEEYEVRGEYKATLPSALTLEFVTTTNETKWAHIADLKKSEEIKEYSYVIKLNKDVKSFKVLHQVSGNGVLSIFGFNVKPLQNGSFDKPYVTLSFDDGYVSFIDKAAPLLKKYNMKAVVPVITGNIGFKNYMTLDDLITIQGLKHEVVAHTRNHIRLDKFASKDSLVGEISGSRYDLEKGGFPTNNFVYPYGSFSEEAVEIVKKSGYQSARTVSRGFNTKNTDKFHLKDQLIDSNVSVAEIDEYLRLAKENNEWVIFELHRITDTPSLEDPESITVEKLDTILKHIQESGIEVITLEQGVKKMSEK